MTPDKLTLYIILKIEQVNMILLHKVLFKQTYYKVC